MKKDTTLGMVKLFEPITQQLQAGTFREKKLGELVSKLQTLIATVRGNECRSDGGEESFSVYKNFSNLNFNKIELIELITKL